MLRSGDGELLHAMVADAHSANAWQMSCTTTLDTHGKRS
jgi:hypothetical protein